MATPTDTETKEIMSAIATLTACITRLESTAAANHAALTQRMEVGFAQMDTKLAEVKGDIKALDQKVIALGDQVKGQDTKFWTLVTIILGSLSTVLIKLLVFPVKPPL